MKFIIFLVATLFIGASISSCGNSGNKKDKSEQQGKEYTSEYVCPMHCEGSGSAEPGKCPVCGMDYILNENKTEEKQEQGHEGHDHNP